MAQTSVLVKPGDTLTVVTAGMPAYSGDFVVSSDGTIQMPVFGQFTVQNRTIADIQKSILAKAKDYIRDPNISVILKLQIVQYVYLGSEKVQDGTFPWTPGLTLRQLVAKHPNLDALDAYVAKFFSPSKGAIGIDLVKLVREGREDQNFVLEPGDVLTLLPKGSRPVWVVGSVSKPGIVRLSDNDGVSHALALAGGVQSLGFSPSQVAITLRRGETVWTKSLAALDSEPVWALEPGDTVSVMLPKQIKITVGGFVKKPGDVLIRENSPIFAGVEAAGGAEFEGSLSRVLIFRKGEILSQDLRDMMSDTKSPGGSLEDGDFVYVSENKQTYNVFGYVNRPGKKFIPDGHEIRLSDALASSEGLQAKGTYRNVVLLRAGSNGKFVAEKFNFDRYMKNGDASQNPKIRTGDVVFFDQVSGTTIQDILRVLPSVILLQGLF